MSGRSDPAAAFHSGTADRIQPMNVFLVGPMGSGKSAVGRQLARQLWLGFVDSDAEIEARTGVDVAYIFEREGEAGFRQREAEIIAELAGRDGLVVATGGGAILDAESRERMRSRGRVVYLRTSVEQQVARTRRSAERPLLNNSDPRGTLARLFEFRAPLYAAAAEFTVDTDGRKVKGVVRDIVRHLGIASLAQEPPAEPADGNEFCE
jgi:shikimate kinase